MKVSIVIPVLDNLQHTKRCIESIRKNTPPSDYELIIVDNGSQPATKNYLASLNNIVVITNEQNLGFAKATNQGISKAKGDYVFLLNNDTALYPYWLERMTGLFDDKVGAVGPVSNYAMGRQMVRVGRKTATPEQINNIVSQTGPKSSITAQFLIGFAMMISREALDKTGVLDERFFAGSEDLDYSLRLQLEGYKLKIAESVFVYHSGSRTSRDLLGKHWDFYKDCNEKFFQKWSKELDTEITSHKQAFEVALSLPGPALTISTIHKNEFGLLENMIRKTNVFCEDYCIVDTGSTNDSVEKLKKMLLNNGTVHSYPWDGSFSNARNHALEKSRGQWILQLDADELIEPKHANLMRIMREKEGIDAYRFKIINFRESPFLIADPKKDIFTAVRMWKNKPEIQYKGMVHETVTESLKGARIAEAAMPILHFAYLKSNSRHFELMKQAAQVEPQRGNNHYFLGEEYIKRGEWSQAISCFKNALACNLTKTNDSAFSTAVERMLNITKAHSQGQDVEEFPKDIKEHFEILVGE